MNPDRRNDTERLDAWLASSKPPAPPPALRAAILAAAQASASMPPATWRDVLRHLWYEIGGLRVAAPALAFALAAGIGLGNVLLQAGVLSDGPTEDLLALALIRDDYRSLAP